MSGRRKVKLKSAQPDNMYEVIFVTGVCVALLSLNIKATTMMNAVIDAPFPTGKDEKASEEEVEAHLNGLLARLPLHRIVMGADSYNHSAGVPVTIADMESRGYLPKNYVSRLFWWHNSPHHKEGWGYNHIGMMLTPLVTFVEALYELPLLSQGSHWIMGSHGGKGRIEETTLAILWHDIGMASTLKPKTMANPDGEGRVPKLYNGEPETTAPLHVKEALRLLDEQKDKWTDRRIVRFDSVRDLVASHMQSHDIWGNGPGAESMRKKLDKVEEFKSDILHEIQYTINSWDYIDTVDSSDWPTFSVVMEALVASNNGNAIQGLNGKMYDALRMESSEMLEFFQQLDHNGAIREVE